MKKYLFLIIIFFLISLSEEKEKKLDISNRFLDEKTDIESSTDYSGSTDYTNSTEKDDSTIIDELKEEKQIKPTLIGLGDYKRINTSKVDNSKNVTISFNFIFKNVAEEAQKTVFLKYIYIKVRLMKKKTSRNLEEKDGFEYVYKILLGILDEESLKSKNVIYKVNDTIEFDNSEIDQKLNDFESIDIDPNIKISDSELTNKTLILEEIKSGSMTSDVIISDSVTLDEANLYIETFEDTSLYFEVDEINHLGFLSYKLVGSLSDNVSLQKETLNFSYKQYDEPKYFEAILEKMGKEEKTYTLSFKLKDFIDANLNDECYAIISGLSIPIKNIRILEENYYQKIVLKEKKLGILKLDETTPQGHNLGHKIASSSGLSGGAIAGIVISCVAVLIGTALAFIFFNKPVIKPTGADAIELYNNNNSSVMVMQ